MDNTTRLIEYLKKRGISKQTAKDFNLALYTNKFKFLGEEFNHEEFVSDVHKQSIIFPVLDVYGELVCISSKNPDQPKYFHKGSKTKTFYGLHTTWKYIEEKNVAVIVEGNFDILKCYEKGIKNVVACLGSAVKDEQLYLLRRFTNRCIIALDGDEAGQKASDKLKKQLDTIGFMYKKVNLPETEDPDSFLTKHTKEEFFKLTK